MNETINAVKRNAIFFAGFFLLLAAGCMFLAEVGKRSSFLFFNSYHSHGADTFFTYYTNLGDGIFAILLVLVYFFILHQKKQAMALLLAYASSGIIAQIIKRLVVSPRPKEFFFPGDYLHFIDGVTHNGNSSMPSGHTATAFAIATVLMIMSKHKNWQLPLLIAAAMVAFSRMYLGQHFLGDVLAGATIGVVCSVAAVYYTRNIDPEKWVFKKNQTSKVGTSLSSGNSNQPS